MANYLLLSLDDESMNNEEEEPLETVVEIKTNEKGQKVRVRSEPPEETEVLFLN